MSNTFLLIIYDICHLTVGEQLDWLRSFYKNPFSLKRLLNAGGLTDIEKQKASSLSGGQLRRLCFAQSLSGDPDLLFLDEPTVGMDVISRIKFWQQINILKQAGKTIILTSHYLDEIEHVASHLLILKNGHFIHDGSLLDLQVRFNQVIISFDSNLNEDGFINLKGVESVTKNGQTVRLHTRDSDTVLRELMQFNKNSIKHIFIERNSLNDLFTNLIEGKVRESVLKPLEK
ncbi:ABC transporter ATP-binding protein [Oenococcus sp. UCMA 17063]|nr:ABC transporter ATP-binding protein [Oenococcus sp. UCMA 17063]